MSVAVADEPGVEVVSVQQDVAKPAPVAVYGVSGAVLLKQHRLTCKRRLGEGACLPSEILHGFGGVLRLRGVHANEPDGVALALNPNLNGISINHSLDVGGNRIKLGAGDKAHESADKHGESGHLGPEWQEQGQAPSIAIL